MFNFFKKKADVLNHWIGFADGFQTSPSEFYDTLAKALAARQVPQMELSRIEFPEGGLLSEKRIYLRMLRERLVFDVCAAPFGSGFFFSCRTAEIPLTLKWWHWLGMLVVSAFAWWMLTELLGFWLGIPALLALFVAAIYVLRNLVAMGLQNLDQTLLELPFVGSLYEVLFRKETYHRIDSRLCYLAVVPEVVKTLAEDTTAAKGVQLVTQYELSPVLGELYKPSPPARRTARKTEAPPAQPPLPT